MKFFTIDNVLKEQKLSENQEESIKNTLFNSRYSRLQYAHETDSQFYERCKDDRSVKQAQREESEDEKKRVEMTIEELDDFIYPSLEIVSSSADDNPKSVAEILNESKSNALKDSVMVNKLIIEASESLVAKTTKHKEEMDRLRRSLLNRTDEREASKSESKDNSLNKSKDSSLPKVNTNDSIVKLQSSLEKLKCSYDIRDRRKEIAEAKAVAFRELERERMQRELDERLAREAELAEQQEKERREREERLRVELELKMRREREEKERVARELAQKQEAERLLKQQIAEKEKAERERAEKERKEREKKRVDQERAKAIQEIDRVGEQLGKAIELTKSMPDNESKLKMLADKRAQLDKLRGDVNASDSIDQAAISAMLATTSDLAKRFVDELARLKKETDLKSQQQRAEEQCLKQVDNNNRNGIIADTFKLYYERHRLSFEKLRQEVEQHFAASAELKAFRFDLQKAINFPVNSLLDDGTSSESRKMYLEKIKTIVRLLSGQTCMITSTLTVSAAKHARGVDFCLLYLAKKIVEKGEETVASRPDTAFQYAQLVVEVCKHLPHFETILFGQFQEKCPFVVPYYKPRQTTQQSTQQYMESLGHKYIDGKLEDEIQYYKRMNGVLLLYFTLLMNQAQLAQPNESDSVLFNRNGLRRAWTWLSDVLNLAPRPEITAEMLTIYFKCCGFFMCQAYGSQFIKLTNSTIVNYLPMIKQIPVEKQSGASVGRLESTFELFRKKNGFDEWKRN